LRKPRRSLRTDDPGSTRDLILEEAMRIIASQGIEELKVKDLARAVGIQPPSVYRHFTSREDIIAALATRMVDDMAARLQPDAALAPRDWMHAWVRGLVGFYASRPAYAIMILREMATPAGVEAMEAALGPPGEAFTRSPLKETSDRFSRVYARGVAEGVFRPRDHAQLTAALLGAVLSALVWPYAPAGKPTATPQDVLRLQDDAVAMFDVLSAAPARHHG
jgi:AcrR family transcriptional regulator